MIGMTPIFSTPTELKEAYGMAMFPCADTKGRVQSFLTEQYPTTLAQFAKRCSETNKSMDTETKQLMHEIWSTSAKRWRESAEWWNLLARSTEDNLLSAFADQQSAQCLKWAAEDEARAERFK